MGRFVSSCLELTSNEYKTQHSMMGQYQHWDTGNFMRSKLLKLFALKTLTWLNRLYNHTMAFHTQKEQ